MSGLELLFHQCSNCHSSYMTAARSGKHECPMCKHVDLIVWEEYAEAMIYAVGDLLNGEEVD